MRTRGSQKGQLLLLFQIKIRARGRCFGGGLEQKESGNGFHVFTDSSPTRAIGSLLRFCLPSAGTASEKMWLYPGMSVRERRQRNQHARSNRSRSDRSNHGPEAAILCVGGGGTGV